MKNRSKITMISTPGLKVGTIEEFIPKYGAYEDKEGNIRSMYWGVAIADIRSKDLIVTPVKKLRIVNVGDEVIGRIVNFSSVYAIVEVFVSNGKSLNRSFSATLHPPRNLSNPKDIHRLYKLGDYILAKVVSKLNRTIHLSIDADDDSKYGVILAFCQRCGSQLIRSKISNNKLICKKCKNIEERKVSNQYGELIKIED